MDVISRGRGWVEAVIQGRWVEAKVYDEPSTYGVGGNGRVSKLSISKTDSRDPQSHFFDQMAYNYDRGLDFDKLNEPGLLDKIVAELEALPKEP